MMKKVLAFTGSNSSKSVNRKLLEYALKKAQSLEVSLIDLRDFPAPIYCMDIEEDSGIPPEIQQLRALFDQADGFVLSSPEHNGMMPAFLKNTMDWLSRTDGKIFQEKPVLVMSTSPGPRGGSTNLENMKTLFPYWGASAVFADFHLGSFYDNFDEANGELKNAEDEDRLSESLRAFEAHLNG
jgi:chromate reductase